MKEIFFITFLLSFITLLSGCNFSNSEKIYECNGTVLTSTGEKSFKGSEYKVSDAVSLTITKNLVEIRGPTALDAVDNIAENGIVNFGLKFNLCKEEKELIHFDNLGCNLDNINSKLKSNSVNGEFNSVTRRLYIRTIPYSRTTQNNWTQQTAEYECKKSL